MIKGRLIIIGEMVVEGETLTGAFIECSKEELKKNRGLFFEDVTISASQPAIEEDNISDLEFICPDCGRKIEGDLVAGHDYKPCGHVRKAAKTSLPTIDRKGS